MNVFSLDCELACSPRASLSAFHGEDKDQSMNEVRLSTVWDDIPHNLQLLIKLEAHHQVWERFYFTDLDVSRWEDPCQRVRGQGARPGRQGWLPASSSFTSRLWLLIFLNWEKNSSPEPTRSPHCLLSTVLPALIHLVFKPTCCIYYYYPHRRQRAQRS